MGSDAFDEKLARNPHYPPHLGGEVMVPRDNRTLAFSTELLNYIIPFATQVSLTSLTEVGAIFAFT